MSEAKRSLASRQQGNGAPAESLMFPQWALDLIRPVVGVSSRLLWKINHIGMENIPLTGGLIVAANHQTYIDPFWVALPIKRPMRFLAWSESFNWPVIGKLSTLFGAWPLQVEKSDPTAIRRSLQWLRGGGAVMIFPEGQRALPDGSMMRFKTGAVRMALEANVPILPVTIRGAHRVWPKGHRFPRLGSVEIIYHPVYQVEMQNGEATRACARRESDRLAEIIGAAL